MSVLDVVLYEGREGRCQAGAVGAVSASGWMMEEVSAKRRLRVTRRLPVLRLVTTFCPRR